MILSTEIIICQDRFRMLTFVEHTDSISSYNTITDIPGKKVTRLVEGLKMKLTAHQTDIDNSDYANAAKYLADNFPQLDFNNGLSGVFFKDLEPLERIYDNTYIGIMRAYSKLSRAE